MNDNEPNVVPLGKCEAHEIAISAANCARHDVERYGETMTREQWHKHYNNALDWYYTFG